MANEATIASTSQLIDVQTRGWCAPLLKTLEIPAGLFSPPAQPGTMLGALRGVPGMDGVPVALVGAHDTASAVASVPADPATSWGYLATGTWALLGVETPEPVLSDLSSELSYTHEGAVNGQFRYLKNCTGMWMIQELRRAWSEGGSAPDFEALMRQAVAAEPFRSFIDPDYPAFQSPGRMPEKMADFCRLTQQPVPETQGEFYRAAMEGREDVLIDLCRVFDHESYFDPVFDPPESFLQECEAYWNRRSPFCKTVERKIGNTWYTIETVCDGTEPLTAKVKRLIFSDREVAC